MNMQEKREYLSNYQMLQRRILGLTYEIEKWNTISSKVNSAMEATGVHSGSVSSKVETGSVNVVDILTEIQKEIDSAKAVRASILNNIRKCSKRMRHSEILEMYFVNGMSHSKIAKLMNKEEKTIANAITVALKELNV